MFSAAWNQNKGIYRVSSGRNGASRVSWFFFLRARMGAICQWLILESWRRLEVGRDSKNIYAHTYADKLGSLRRPLLARLSPL